MARGETYYLLKRTEVPRGRTRWLACTDSGARGGEDQRSRRNRRVEAIPNGELGNLRQPLRLICSGL